MGRPVRFPYWIAKAATMKIIGEPYTIFLQTEPVKLTNKHQTANAILIQAKGEDAYYRLDGGAIAVNGFALPRNEVLVVYLAKNNAALSVWTTETMARVCLVVQEINDKA